MKGPHARKYTGPETRTARPGRLAAFMSLASNSSFGADTSFF